MYFVDESKSVSSLDVPVIRLLLLLICCMSLRREGGGAGSPSAQGGAAPSSVRFDDGGGSATGGGQGASQEIDWATALMPQLRETQMENAMLQKRLQQADREINALRSLPSVGAGSPGGFEQARPDSSYRDAKDAKIVELAKKNRALTVALEKERAKSGRMAAEVTRMNGQLQEASKGRDMSGMDARSLPKGAAGGREPAGATRRGGKKGEEDEEDKPSPEAQIKTLQGKLSNMNAALNAQRVANDTLKQENGKLLSVLKRELGDVPVERALEEGGGWTGRAQQVSLLQSKITSLRRELQAAREGGAGGGAAGGGLGVPGSPQQDGAMREEEKRRKEIDKIEREKRREQDVGAEELERVRKERDENKRMYGAAQSRVKNLEKDCKDLRDKISVLLTKTDNDDSLIAALQQEMQNMARQNKENKRKEREQQGSISELQELRGQISERESQIERQHKIIVSLRAEAQASSMRREGEHREAVANGVDAVRATQAEQKARMAEVQVKMQTSREKPSRIFSNKFEGPPDPCAAFARCRPWSSLLDNGAARSKTMYKLYDLLVVHEMLSYAGCRRCRSHRDTPQITCPPAMTVDFRLF